MITFIYFILIIFILESAGSLTLNWIGDGGGVEEGILCPSARPDVRKTRLWYVCACLSLCVVFTCGLDMEAF